VTQPRQPTEKEINELVEWDLEGDEALSHPKPTGEELEDLRSTMTDAYIAVFDDYQGYYSTYSGKVMMVVWPWIHNHFDLFIWPDGKLTRVTEVHRP
jgi:hypothetical protein